MTIRLGINGFGRIGRTILRSRLADPRFADIEIVAVNDTVPAATMVHLLRYDSVMGRLPGEVVLEGSVMRINGQEVGLLGEETPAAIPWQRYGVDYVLECSGRFTGKEDAAGHLAGGARRVILSAPGKGEMPTFVLGVNEEHYDPVHHRVVSNASCTTNCLAPVARVVLEHLGIRRGVMTTIHAYTNDQRLLDAPHKDLRRARAAGVSMIPTKTGAASSIGLVLPRLQGRFDGLSVRVPTPNVSMVDVTMEVERETTTAEVNRILREAADGRILGYTDEPLVSVDFLGDPRSGVVDGSCTRVMGDLVKVMIWYDNEWGYSNRILELAQYMAAREG